MWHITSKQWQLSAMTVEDIRQTIRDFRHAAKVAQDAGFDGVRIQAGFVYLFQQFLQETSNLRLINMVVTLKDVRAFFSRLWRLCSRSGRVNV
jgi:hypothetical protein